MPPSIKSEPLGLGQEGPAWGLPKLSFSSQARGHYFWSLGVSDEHIFGSEGPRGTTVETLAWWRHLCPERGGCPRSYSYGQGPDGLPTPFLERQPPQPSLRCSACQTVHWTSLGKTLLQGGHEVLLV